MRCIFSHLDFNVGSVGMLIALLMCIIPYLYALFYANTMLTNATFCKVRVYIIHLVTVIFRWLFAAASIDRYAITSTNNRLRNLASIHTVYRVVLKNGIIWLVVPVQILFLFNVKDNRCGIVHSIDAALYFSCHVLIAASILPTAIMVICAILIQRNLRLRLDRCRQLTSNGLSEEENLEQRRDQQFVAMLFLQISVFVITLTPWTILYFYNSSTIYVTNKSADRAAIEGFLSYTAEVIVLPIYDVVTNTSRRTKKAFISSITVQT